MTLFHVFLLGCFIAPALTIRLTHTAVHLAVALFHVARIFGLLLAYAVKRWGLRRAAWAALTVAAASSALLLSPAARAGEVKCLNEQPQYFETLKIPAAGQPGAVFVGAHDPGKREAYFLTPRGWERYEGGLYGVYQRFDEGLPAALPLQSLLPKGISWTSREVVDWSIYIGFGVLTPEAQDMVKSRREALNELKPQRVAEGRWDANYDSDDQFKWALVQRNMVDNSLYQMSVDKVPLLYCRSDNGNN